MMFYYGCWAGIGHHAFLPNGQSATQDEMRCPWSQYSRSFSGACIDGGLQPLRGDIPHDVPQPEGLARLTQEAGWTALSFWDRSIDKRGGSHSTFVAEGTFTFAQMVEQAKRLFPTIWARYTFRLTAGE